MMRKSDLLNAGVTGGTLENGTCFSFSWWLTIRRLPSAVKAFKKTNIATARSKFTDRE